MKFSLLIFFTLLISVALQSQNVGIGTSQPITKLHVASSSPDGFILENTNTFTTGVTTAMYFGNNLANAGTSFKYSGAIKTIATTAFNARMGLFTHASVQPDLLHENVSITDIGNVGIGNTNPLYTLDVFGTFHLTSTAYLDANFFVAGSAGVTGNIGISGNATISGNTNVNGSLGVVGNVTVSNGHGLVRSNSGNQQKIVRTEATFKVPGLAAYSYAISGILAYETFGGIPTVTVGGVNNGNGNWYQIIIYPANITTTSCQFVIYNSGPSILAFDNVTWQVLVTGPQ